MEAEGDAVDNMTADDGSGQLRISLRCEVS